MTPTLTLSSGLAMAAHALVLIAALVGVVLIGVFARRLGGATASLGIVGCLCVIPESIIQATIQLHLYTISYETVTTLIAVLSAAILLRSAGIVLLIIALLLGVRRRSTSNVVPQTAAMQDWPVQPVAPQPTVPGLTWPMAATEQPDPSTDSPPAGPAH